MEERRRHTTVRQLELLVEFLQHHKDLALGRIRSKEARAVATRLWRECTIIVNAEGPARTPKEWAKVWNDLKCRVRAKLVSINANQQATGGGPSNAVTLTPLEDRVSNILGRDVGPLPNVRQNHFATQDDEGSNSNAEAIIANSEPIIVQINEVDDMIDTADVQTVTITTELSRTPSLVGQVPSPSASQTNRSALDESRTMVLEIETLRAEAALNITNAMKTFGDGFKLLAESVDRLSRMYTQQHAPEGQGN